MEEGSHHFISGGDLKGSAKCSVIQEDLSGEGMCYSRPSERLLGASRTLLPQRFAYSLSENVDYVDYMIEEMEWYSVCVCMCVLVEISV